MEEKKDPIQINEEKFKETGKKIQSLGCTLTFLLTLPIVGLFTLGIGGLIIGLVLGIIIFIGMQQGEKKAAKKREE